MARNDRGRYITPKWLDRILIAVIVAIPILYVLGFSVNYGPSMSHIGWIYKTDWGRQPIRVGQIVRFATPNQPSWRKYLLPCIKRVAQITPNGYWLEGDNTDQSNDSRDWNKVVPFSHIAGLVTWCWSLKRVLNAQTEQGRIDNWRNFDWGPNAQWSPDGKYVAFSSQAGMSIFSISKSKSRLLVTDAGFFRKDSGGGVGWRDGKVMWTIREPWGYSLYDLKTHKLSRFHAHSTRLSELGWIDQKTVVIAGDATLLIKKGDTYKGRKIKSVYYPFPCAQFNGPTDLVHTKVCF